MNRHVLRGAVVVLCSVTGCATLPTLQSPRTIEKGTLRAGLEGSFLATAGGRTKETSPTMAATARYGVTDDVEVGLRAGFIRPELFATFRLGEAKRDGVAFAWSPMVGATYNDDSAIGTVYVYGSAAFLAGIPLFGRTELVLAPKLDFGFAQVVKNAAKGFSMTGVLSVGWEIRLLDWLRVMPAAAVGYALVSATNSTVTFGGGAVVQAALMVLFGDGARDGGPHAK